jgi:hypothetical protein
MVMARVALNCARFTTSSPGMSRATSSVVAPHRRCHGLMKGDATQTGTAVSVSRSIPARESGDRAIQARLRNDIAEPPPADQHSTEESRSAGSKVMCSRTQRSAPPARLSARSVPTRFPATDTSASPTNARSSATAHTPGGS